ncbi:ribokinase [Helcococcus kunzii]|uniref:ribokinase n=1 Tax=Helcococcus kunzii TaxID=40091 RepID=UPI0024AE2A28|nr:ribokinase [Helcococcus kunzii]
MKILNFGSINIDFVYSVNRIVQEGETIASNNLEIFNGGKGFNQSISIARSGIEVYHFGKVGEDGKYLIDCLSESNVNTDFIIVDKNKRTGNAIIQRDRLGNNCIILYSGTNKSFTNNEIDNVLSKFNKNDILLLTNEVNKVEYIIKESTKKGMIIIFNPAPFKKKILNYNLKNVDYLVINEIEGQGLANIKNQRNDSDRLIKILADKYPKTKIILTLGKNGSIYYYNNQMIKKEIYNVNVVDTTGAGDTYIGYFISGLIQSKSVNEILDISTAASALCVTKKGAEPSIPTIETVNNFLRKMEERNE